VSWGAVDDQFWAHRKVMRLRRSPCFERALALWVLSMSWCCAQEQERYTGVVPVDLMASFGITDWESAAAALVDVGLWEHVDEDHAKFHDWSTWNGIAGKEFRSKEATRRRTAAYRLRKCESGEHSKDCPPETCPKKIARRAQREAAAGTGSPVDAGPSRPVPSRPVPSRPVPSRRDVTLRHAASRSGADEVAEIQPDEVDPHRCQVCGRQAQDHEDGYTCDDPWSASKTGTTGERSSR
jgi:hypothetical protein